MKVRALIAILFVIAACGKTPSVKNEAAILGVWKLTAATVDGAPTGFDPQFIRFKASAMNNAKPNDVAWSGNIAYRLDGNLIYLKDGINSESVGSFSFSDKSFNLRIDRAGKPITYVYQRPAEGERSTYPAE